jgi:hypothetical protein
VEVNLKFGSLSLTHQQYGRLTNIRCITQTFYELIKCFFCVCVSVTGTTCPKCTTNTWLVEFCYCSSDLFRDEMYRDVKTSWNNLRGCIIRGQNIWGHNIWEIMVTVLRLHSHSARKILKTNSESSFPGAFNDTSFSSLGLSWTKKSLFKGKKMIQLVSASFLALKCSLWIVSTSSNDECLGQNKPRELKLVSLLELSRNEDTDSNNFLKNC